MLSFLKTMWRDWLARMTGPLSLILLFTPIISPQFKWNTLVWIVAFICLLVSAYRVWRLEFRARIPAKLDPLIEEVRLLRQLWEKIQYDHGDSDLVRFPLAGFDVREWKEVHKQLLRLFFWTDLQAQRVQWRFNELDIAEQSRLSAVMNNQNLRRSINALNYTNLLEEHAAMLAKLRERLGS